jgi:hypothetical protein
LASSVPHLHRYKSRHTKTGIYIIYNLDFLDSLSKSACKSSAAVASSCTNLAFGISLREVTVNCKRSKKDKGKSPFDGIECTRTVMPSHICYTKTIGDDLTKKA